VVLVVHLQGSEPTDNLGKQSQTGGAVCRIISTAAGKLLGKKLTRRHTASSPPSELAIATTSRVVIAPLSLESVRALPSWKWMVREMPNQGASPRRGSAAGSARRCWMVLPRQRSVSTRVSTVDTGGIDRSCPTATTPIDDSPSNHAEGDTTDCDATIVANPSEALCTDPDADAGSSP